jgi:hypothetical protein
MSPTLALRLGFARCPDNTVFGSLAMKSPGLLIAALILASLSGVLYWSNRHKPNSVDEGNVKLKQVESPKILAFNHDDIIQLAIRHKDTAQIDLSRNNSGAWQITSPKPLSADQDAVASFLSSFSSVSSDRVVDEKPGDLVPFGLKPPAVELDATLKDKSTRKLLIGDQTPAGNSYYVMLSGDPRLFTIASYVKSGLDKSAGDLRDKRLLTADFDNVSQIDLLNQKSPKKQQITFARNKDSWQILKPEPFRAASSRVEDLIHSLKQVELDVTSDEAKDTAAFRSAVPFSTVKITGASGTQELEVRQVKKALEKKPKEKGKKQENEIIPADYYAKSSVVPGIYKVPTSLATDLDKSVEDFRDKNLFDFGFSEPNKIEIHEGGKAYFLTHSGSDWWGPDGKKFDSSTVQPVIDALRELSASKFPDSGFTVPALDIKVISNNNQRTEKVLISKNGERCIAKRESEPALYELAPSAVSALQKSASELKPSLPPAPTKK